MLEEAIANGLPGAYLLNPFLRMDVKQVFDWSTLVKQDGKLIPAISNELAVREIFSKATRPYVVLTSLNRAIHDGDVAAFRNGWFLLSGEGMLRDMEFVWDEAQMGLSYGWLQLRRYLIEWPFIGRKCGSSDLDALESFRAEFITMLNRGDTHAERLRSLCEIGLVERKRWF